MLKAPTARETSVDSCGPEHPQRTSRQWESSGGQPGDKCGRKGGDKCRITCGPEHPQSQKQVGDKRGTNAEPCGPKHPQTTAIQRQNYAAQSTHGVLRDSGGQVGDKWETRETSLDSGGPDHLERIWERSAGSCGSKHPQHTAKQVERSGRSGGEKRGTMQPRASIALLCYSETVRRKWETSVESHAAPITQYHPQHPRRVYWKKSNAQERKPGDGSKIMQPFHGSKKPIQVAQNT